MATEVACGDAARQGIMRGVNRLADAVRVTLGPRGRHVILEASHGSPTITRDGASVANFVMDPERMEVALDAPSILIDPAKVVRSAPRNAASIAPLLLTTEAAVAAAAEDQD